MKQLRMTKQYCRYCSYCVVQLDDWAWCEKRQKEMNERAAKCMNKCKDFVFNEIDAFNIEAKYKPRAKKEKLVDNSPLLFEV